MRHPTQAIGAIIGLVALLAGCGASTSDSPAATADSGRWVGSWATAPYGPYPAGPLTQPGVAPYTAQFPDHQADDQSFRMVVHPSLGGERVRACWSNAQGDRPLRLSSAYIGEVVAGPVVQEQTALSFHGEPTVTLPVGARVCSDAVGFQLSPGEDVAVSFHVPDPSGPMTWHAEAFAVNYVSPPGMGDVASDPSGAGFTQLERSWFFLSDLQVETDEGFAITAFGDSITDGAFSTPGLNHRYPDFLARRLQAAAVPAGVRNLGINSNTVTTVRDGGNAGPPGIQRFADDVLRAGTRSVFVLLGTNDLSAGVPADTVYTALVDLAAQAHAAGVCIVVSTILPRNDPPVPFGWDVATDEPERRALNALLMNSTAFDAVADVASAMANPLDPNQPFQPYFVEGLHPNSLGMQALADAIPLAALLPPPYGDCDRTPGR
ncbi:MAG: GDSL-type esterase/lipase family protein [Abyssibacter sp.]|uniref:GDSL-type esterase/lipase family protein n=1 Tax=Abyssibacter sp. TaxID=2320200 RepID=UPI003219886F